MADQPTSSLRLTQVVASAGCAAKLGPNDLAVALRGFGPLADPRLLVGPETLDDAAVVAINSEVAVCFTADFITPLVDDPRTWGRIAATNALSDVYAMGGTPLAALNLVCWPKTLPLDLLGEVLAGGRDAADAAAALVVGGHSVEDPEPKYGMAVIGTVHPGRVLRNVGAEPGDALFLTKPLGTGIVSTAIKADLAPATAIEAAVASMTTLNRGAGEAAVATEARALTDVTGFSLMGHLSEMLGKSSRLGAAVSVSALPVLPGALDLLAQGMAPAGAYRNRLAYQPRVTLASDVDRQQWEMLLYDPQTSGGLLAAVPPGLAGDFVEACRQRQSKAWWIGEFTDSGRIEVIA